MTTPSGTNFGLTIATPAVEFDPDLASAQGQLEQLPESARKALYEVIQAAADVSGSRDGTDTTLADVIQQVFVRSVAEFFTTQRQSTQMPPELVHHILPAPGSVPLPEPGETLEIGLGTVLDARKSSRNFANRPLTQSEVSTLLHYAAGKRGVEAGYGIKDVPLFRYPTIGGLNSVQVGVIINRVEGLGRGFYLYDPVGHALILKDRGDMRLAVQEITFESEWLFHAPIVLVLMHHENKVSWKYKTRGYRFSHVDLGAVMQNFYLVATGQNLGCCAVAGFFDEGANNFLQLDGTTKFVSLFMGVGPIGQITFAETE